jgi:hypothetical protein
MTKMKNHILKRPQRTKMKSLILTIPLQDQTKERLQRTKMKNQILKILQHHQNRRKSSSESVLYNNVPLSVKGKVFIEFQSILLKGKFG